MAPESESGDQEASASLAPARNRELLAGFSEAFLQG
jgi:hypothetical protein